MLAAVAMIITVGVVDRRRDGRLRGVWPGRACTPPGLWSQQRPVHAARRAAPSDSPTADPDAGSDDQPQRRPSRRPANPGPVLAAATSGPAPDQKALAARIAAVRVKDAQGNYSGAVLDVRTGKPVFRHQAGRGPHPGVDDEAADLGGGAVATFGPEHTFTTSVVKLEGQPDHPGRRRRSLSGQEVPRRRLSQARLDHRSGAEPRRPSCGRARPHEVSLGYDASRFSGPAWNPAWPSVYGDQVTPVSALWVDEGRVNGGSPGPRVSDPAGERGRGLRGRAAPAGRTGHQRPPGQGPALRPAKVASVSSMPLQRIVEQVLMVSDNDGAEVLFRQVAVGDKRKGSSAEAAKAVRAVLTKLGAVGRRHDAHRRQRAGSGDQGAGRHDGPGARAGGSASSIPSSGR